MNQTKPDETATLGGGCFWCLETLFRELNGVKKVVSAIQEAVCLIHPIAKSAHEKPAMSK